MFRFFFSLSQWKRVVISLTYLSVVAFLELMPERLVPDFQFPWEDKIVHACMYLGLTILLCWTFHSEHNRDRIIMIFLIAISFGVLMEIFQFEMGLGRSFEWFDILSNILGALFGAALFLFISRKLRRI
jgi:VanZ family protein